MNILDGIKSLALKLGSKQDQTYYARGLSLTDDLMQIEALWRDNWIANKVCIKRSEDMVRNWRDIFSNDLKSEQLDEFTKLERRLKLRETLTKALQWSSLYGAVGLLLVTDTINITSPLQPTERLKRLIILPKWKISPTGQRDDDVFSPNFGRYSEYTIIGGTQSVLVHHSRLLIINANDAPLSDNDVWGCQTLKRLLMYLNALIVPQRMSATLFLKVKSIFSKLQGYLTRFQLG